MNSVQLLIRIKRQKPSTKKGLSLLDDWACSYALDRGNFSLDIQDTENYAKH
jgi:hypothetical protein